MAACGIRDACATRKRWRQTLRCLVPQLPDSVQRIDGNSALGRDPRLHHFLRGLLLQSANRHAEAVEAFRAALFSLTDGCTRTNLELAQSHGAGPAHCCHRGLQPALRGRVDGSNAYVTHTELGWQLAQAFEAAGQLDSAAVQYARVARAWRNADPQFAERYRNALAKSVLSN